jgi:hypothetical protein
MSKRLFLMEASWMRDVRDANPKRPRYAPCQCAKLPNFSSSTGCRCDDYVLKPFDRTTRTATPRKGVFAVSTTTSEASLEADLCALRLQHVVTAYDEARKERAYSGGHTKADDDARKKQAYAGRPCKGRQAI